jgi:hypothetical protein
MLKLCKLHLNLYNCVTKIIIRLIYTIQVMIVYPYTVHYEVYKYKQMQEQLQYQLICKDVMLNLPDEKHNPIKYMAYSKGLFIWAKVIPVSEKTFRQV